MAASDFLRNAFHMLLGPDDDISADINSLFASIVQEGKSESKTTQY